MSTDLGVLLLWAEWLEAEAAHMAGTDEHQEEALYQAARAAYYRHKEVAPASLRALHADLSRLEDDLRTAREALRKVGHDHGFQAHVMGRALDARGPDARYGASLALGAVTDATEATLARLERP